MSLVIFQKFVWWIVYALHYFASERYFCLVGLGKMGAGNWLDGSPRYQLATSIYWARSYLAKGFSGNILIKFQNITNLLDFLECLCLFDISWFWREASYIHSPPVALMKCHSVAICVNSFIDATFFHFLSASRMVYASRRMK